MTVTIRQALISDAEALAKLSRETFHETFDGHPKNDPEDMRAYVAAAFADEQIAAELAAQDNLFLVAEKDERAVGYAKLTFDTREPEISGERPAELSRLYARKEMFGKGIGQLLLSACLQAAAQKGCDVMWLGVWEYNPRAQRFYEKHGFRVVGSHVFLLGRDPQTDLLMEKPISSDDNN